MLCEFLVRVFACASGWCSRFCTTCFGIVCCFPLKWGYPRYFAQWLLWAGPCVLECSCLWHGAFVCFHVRTRLNDCVQNCSYVGAIDCACIRDNGRVMAGWRKRRSLCTPRGDRFFLDATSQSLCVHLAQHISRACIHGTPFPPPLLTSQLKSNEQLLNTNGHPLETSGGSPLLIPLLRTLGIEPRSHAWGACMMPLHYVRFCQI